MWARFYAKAPQEGNTQMLSKLWKLSCPRSARRAFDLRFLKRFGKDAHGGVLVYTALALPILLGVAGLSVDVGFWYAAKRVTQASADAGALAAALEVMRLE